MKHALLLVLLVSSAAAAQQPEGKVRVGTWNIENLGSRSEARGDADFERLAGYVKELGVDVLAVQEVNGQEPLRRLCKALGPRWSFVVGTSGKIGSRQGSRQITVGFVFDEARVELLDAYELNDLPRREDKNYIFHRIPVVATFRERKGGIDFRAVVVHLKAGQLDVNERSPQDSAKRQAEVKHLCARLEQLLGQEGEDQDLLVLGDFNADPKYPAYKALAQRLSHVDVAKAHRSIVYFDEQIDHVFLSKGLTEELVAGSCNLRYELYEKLGKDAWKAQYSDHIPLVVDLDAARDRDPDAKLTPGPKEHQLPKLNGEGAAPAKAREEAPERSAQGAEPPGRRWF